MRIRDHMDKNPRHHVRNLRDHHQKKRILGNVPVVRSQNIVGPLVQHSIEHQLPVSPLLCDVERHAVGAWVEVHLMEILMHIEVRQDPPAERIVSEVIEHTVGLIKQSLLIDMLHAHLVAICFPDGTVLIRPLIPDVAVEIMHVVRLPLPDPQNFIHGALQSRPPQRQCGELLPEVVPVADTKLLDRVGRRSVRPVRPDLLSARIRAILQNVSAHVDKNMITLTHVLLLEDADLYSCPVPCVCVLFPAFASRSLWPRSVLSSLQVPSFANDVSSANPDAFCRNRISV